MQVIRKTTAVLLLASFLCFPFCWNWLGLARTTYDHQGDYFQADDVLD